MFLERPNKKNIIGSRNHPDSINLWRFPSHCISWRYIVYALEWDGRADSNLTRLFSLPIHHKRKIKSCAWLLQNLLTPKSESSIAGMERVRNLSNLLSSAMFFQDTHFLLTLLYFLLISHEWKALRMFTCVYLLKWGQEGQWESDTHIFALRDRCHRAKDFRDKIITAWSVSLLPTIWTLPVSTSKSTCMALSCHKGLSTGLGIPPMLPS